MRVPLFSLLLACCLSTRPALAQQYVECGTQPVVSNGQVVGESPKLCRQPYEATVTAVGFLAMNEAKTAYGFDVGVSGFGHDKVKRRAIEKCNGQGSPCTVVARYMPSLFSRAKRCVGIANDEQQYVWSFGSTDEEARSNALKACTSAGRSCKSETVASCAVGVTMTKY